MLLFANKQQPEGNETNPIKMGYSLVILIAVRVQKRWLSYRISKVKCLKEQKSKASKYVVKFIVQNLFIYKVL